jgi:hypothetical protein
VATTLHTVATCGQPGCPWEYDGPDADAKANQHTTSKAAGAVHHPTTTRTHPTTRCGKECS